MVGDVFCVFLSELCSTLQNVHRNSAAIAIKWNCGRSLETAFSGNDYHPNIKICGGNIFWFSWYYLFIKMCDPNTIWFSWPLLSLKICGCNIFRLPRPLFSEKRTGASLLWSSGHWSPFRCPERHNHHYLMRRFSRHQSHISPINIRSKNILMVLNL